MRGFTLAEMTVSLGAVAVISAATMSVMVVASRSMPRAGDRTMTAGQGRRVLERVYTDLMQAREVTPTSGADFTVRVPDVTGDATEDLVRYWWDGARGGWLRRQVNGGPAEDVAGGVEAFGAEWSQRPSVNAGAGAAAYGSEVLLAACDLPATGTGRLKSGDLHGQWVRPVLPADATHYQVTRVQVRVNRNVSTAVSLGVSLQTDGGGKPSGTSLGSATMTVTGAWGTNGFQTAVFSPAVERAGGQGVWVVVTPPVLGTNDTLPVSTQVADDAQAYAAGGTVLLVTSWTAVSDSSLQFQLYGQVKRPTDVGLSRSDAVALSLSLGALPGTVHRGGGVLPGSPVVTTVAPTQEPTGVVGTLLDRIGGILSGLTLRGGW